MAKQKREIVAVFSAQNKAKGVMAGFRRGLDSTGQAMKRMAKVGAVMAVAAAAGLAYLVKRQMDAIDVIAKLSDRLGIATEDLVGLQHAASISGVSTEALNKSLDMFVRRLGEMTIGSGEAKRGLDMLGLTTAELIRLSPAEAMGIAADRINRLETQAEKAAAAYFLFGRAGAQLVTMFAVGSKGLREFQREAEKLGLTFSRFDAAQVEVANDALTRARATMTGLVRQATIELAPYIETLANKFVDLATEGEGVGAKVINAFEAMSKGAIQFGVEIQGASAKFKAFRAGALEAAAELLDILTWMEKYSGGTLFDKIFGTEVTGGPGRKAEEYRQRAAELMESATKEAVSLYGQVSAIEKFYDDLRKKAAGETTKTIKEQYADALRAKIAMIDAEIAKIEEASELAKRLAEEDKKVIIEATQEQVKFVREQDYMTRTQRIQNLEAYKAAHQETLDMVLAAEKILTDELEKLERGKFEDTKRWLTESSDLWLQLDRIAVKSLESMADALTDLCLTGEADFKALAQSIILDITRMMIKMQMAQLLGIRGGGGPNIGQMLWSGVTGSFAPGAGGMATVGTVTPGAGAMYARYQHGTIATRPHLAMVGEVPEAIVPLSGGRSIPVEMRSGGGGGNLDVHIHNEGEEKLEISEVEEYMLGDDRIVNVFMQRVQTDGPLRRSIKQIR